MCHPGPGPVGLPDHSGPAAGFPAGHLSAPAARRGPADGRHWAVQPKFRSACQAGWGRFSVPFVALVGFECEGLEHLRCSCFASLHSVELSTTIFRVRDRELVTLGGRPPSWLGDWCSGDLFKKIVKRPGLLLRGACEVVVELAISGAEEKLTIRKGPLSFVGVIRRIGFLIYIKRKSSHEMWIKLKEMFGGSTSHLVGGDSEELSSPSHHEELQVASTSGRDESSSSSTSPTCCKTQEEIKELEAQVLSLKKDLEKRHEGKSALDKMLSVQQSPNDKSGLGFNSNNKIKSKNKNNKKKGQDKVKDSAKIVCFKCKVEGHHVRSCPLKKKKHLSEKQQGKRPQGQGQAHARPQVEDRPLPKKNQDKVPQEKKSIKKKKGNTCYLCRKKGHFASSCLGGTLSNPIIVDDDYSLGKDKDGNVFAKFVGTQSGFKKRTIWVAKPIVTNLLGPNLVGDQQSQT
ncbi:hypothetical protein QYE76_019230 [Lolium multiflorum]|uniref:CCHC-type domain-containing protein n=1 Tax=Lolium multiflorum TaxID=4521 RepID=A0AAD8VR23_LOLMU|nr:hypothetical protein QYE76_019230 [Lolium multiflorum]